MHGRFVFPSDELRRSKVIGSLKVTFNVLSWVTCGTELSHGEHQARFMALKRDVYKMKVRS